MTPPPRTDAAPRPDQDALLLRRGQVAELVGLPERTLRRLVSSGAFPRPVALGKSVRWRRSDVTRWVDQLEADPGPLLVPIDTVTSAVALSRRTIDYLVDAGHFPEPVAAGRKKLWRWSEVAAWAETVTAVPSRPDPAHGCTPTAQETH